MKSLRALLLLLLLLPSLSLAEPMPPASVAEGVKTSPKIVIAEYKGYQKAPIKYFGGVNAEYAVKSVLKGEAAAGKVMVVNYAFHDGSPCLEPQGWAFQPKMMPKAGSRWILLLQNGGTYRGDFGRLPYSEANLKKVKSLL